MSSTIGFKKKDMDRAVGQVKAGKTVKLASKACNVPQAALQEHVQKARTASTTKEGATAPSGSTRQMDVYLTMLYVTLEQETALKKFFTSKGWRYTKPDLSVTTEKVGPASHVSPSSPTKQGNTTQKGVAKTKSTEVRRGPSTEAKKSPIKTGNQVSTPATTRASPRLQSRPRRAFNKYGEDFEIKSPGVKEIKVEVASDEELEDEDPDEDEADMDDDFADDLNEYDDSGDDDDDNDYYGGLDDSQMEDGGGEGGEDDGKGGKKRAAEGDGEGSPETSGTSRKKQKTASLSTPGTEGEEEEEDTEKMLEMTDSVPIESSSSNSMEGEPGDLQSLKKPKLETQSPSTENSECSICQRRFTGPNSLFQHIRQKHKKKQTKSKLVKHETDDSVHDKKSSKTTHVCLECKAHLSTKQALFNHLKTKHDIELSQREKIVSCGICAATYRYKKDLLQHMKQEHGVEPPPKSHICDICGVVCKRSDNLLEHMRHVHQGLPRKNKFMERKHTCEICGNCFFRKAHLKEHMLVKHSDNPLPHTCPKCGQGFIRPKILEAHMNKAHLNVKPYSCPHCKKSFFSSSSMNTHVVSGVCPSIGKREFPCSLCGKAFCTSRNLDMHVLAMHGGGAFTCVCGDVVRWASSVAKHKRRCKAYQEKYHPETIEGFNLKESDGSTTIVIIGGEDAGTIELSDKRYQEMEQIGAIQSAQTADTKTRVQQVQHAEVETATKEICVQFEKSRYEEKGKTPWQKKSGSEKATKMVLLDNNRLINNNESMVKEVIAEIITGQSAAVGKKSTQTDLESQAVGGNVVVQHVSASSAFSRASTTGDVASTSQETVESGTFAVEDMSNLVHIVQEQVTVGDSQEVSSQYDIPVMQEIYVVTMPE